MSAKDVLLSVISQKCKHKSVSNKWIRVHNVSIIFIFNDASCNIIT